MSSQLSLALDQIVPLRISNGSPTCTKRFIMGSEGSVLLQRSAEVGSLPAIIWAGSGRQFREQAAIAQFVWDGVFTMQEIVSKFNCTFHVALDVEVVEVVVDERLG